MNKMLLLCFLGIPLFTANIFLGNKNAISDSDNKTIESKALNKRLFVIERNMNKNTVCYDANVLKNGTLNQEDPIDAYWIDYASDGKRSELNYIQRRMAYGYSFEKTALGAVSLTLKAFDKRKILVSIDNKGNSHALIKINNIDANLTRIFVTAKPKMYTTVEFIELYGNDIRTGKIVYEKIVNL
ncbi:MAG: DUF4833 domain-containing protein [Bacteroidales bacterium]